MTRIAISSLLGGCTLLLFSATLCFGQTEAPITYREYHSNGKIKSIRHQGNFAGCGVPVGTDSLFNTAGLLTETITYVHQKDAKEAGCHAMRTFEKKLRFNLRGKITSSTYYQYAYESEPVASSRRAYEAALQRR